MKEEIQSKAFYINMISPSDKGTVAHCEGAYNKTWLIMPSSLYLDQRVKLIPESDLFKEDGSGIVDRLAKENKELRELLISADEILADFEDFIDGKIGDRIAIIRHQIEEHKNLLNQTKKD